MRPTSDSPTSGLPEPGRRLRRIPPPPSRSEWQAWRRAWVARLAARDPAWRRARRALRSSAGAALSLGINAAVASAAHQSTGVPLLGAVVAMLCGLSVTEDDRREAGLTFLTLPFLAAASVACGAALSPHRFVSDAVFVAIVFAATSLRRRGPRWSAAGFLAFMTYFFSQFLHATPAQVPWLALAATVGVAVAALLRLVLLPEHPDRTLRRLLQALEGQTATLLDAAVDVLQRPDVPSRLRRRALSASGDLNRVALMVEEQLGVGPATEVEPLRDRVFVLEVSAAHTVSAVRAAVREGLTDAERQELATEVVAVSRAIRSGRAPRALGRWAESVRSGRRSDGQHGNEKVSDPYHGARHVRRALAELADAAAALQRGEPDRRPLDVWGEPAGEQGAHRGSDEDDAAADARSGVVLGLQQGLQATVAVALAIVVGESLSPSRWYWAAIAAYIVFVGADTRGATIRRAIARTVGTLAGLIGGLVVALLVSGSKPAAIVLIFLLLFAAWWLQPVSFLAGTVCVTVVLALLYVLLGTFSGHLLLLRVEETAIGAVLGGLAALVLVPARSSPAVREAEADVLDHIADTLRAVRSGRGSGSALRELDTAFQNLRDVARPVAKGVPGAAARRVEQRVYALSAASYSARMLVTALVRRPELGDGIADRLERLAARAEGLAASARAAEPDPIRSTALERDPEHDEHGHGPSEGASDVGSGGSAESSARAHARVAVERLDLALSRWADPFRAPMPPGTPQAATTPSSSESAPHAVRAG